MTEEKKRELSEFYGRIMDSIGDKRESNNWISVNERLPEPLTRVFVSSINIALICYSSALYMGGRKFIFDTTPYEIKMEWVEKAIKSIKNVTHWMPIPELPKENKKNI